VKRLELVWDDETTEHLVEHGVEPQEAAEVCYRHPYVLRTRHSRYLVLGQSSAGRYLTVIVEPLGRGQARLITARPMTEHERRRYQQR